MVPAIMKAYVYSAKVHEGQSRLSGQPYLSHPLAVAGLFLIVAPEWSLVGPDYRSGLYLGLAAAVCYGSFLIIMRLAGGFRSALSPLANITLASIFSTLFLLPRPVAWTIH